MAAVDNSSVRFSLLNPNATLPSRGSSGAAGLDLSSVEAAILLPGHRKLVSTGLAVRVPDGTYGRIAPRSGLALKCGIDVLAGVVDSDYRGTVGVLLFKLLEPFEVRIGDRIAQLVVERISMADPVAVPFAELEASARGEGGFGSTGKGIPS